jgi:Ca2+/Na+ antiporter
VFIGTLILFLYADDFIQFTAKAAQRNELNSTLLAFFLAPIAIDLPDIILSWPSNAGKRDSVTLAISNFVSSAVSKTSLVLGLICLYGYWHELQWQNLYALDLFIIAACSLAAGVAVWVPTTLNKSHGVMLFAVFLLVALCQYMYSSSLDFIQVTYYFHWF